MIHVSEFKRLEAKEMNERALIIADDFTGANDTGVKLVKLGSPVNVVFSSMNWNEKDNYVLDTETRNSDRQESKNKLLNLLKDIDFSKFSIVYKKVDSTLRGNLVEEIKVVASLFNPDYVVFDPALPSQGRIIKEANLYENKTRLDKTEFKKDPEQPVTEINTFKILKKTFGIKESKHYSVKEIRKAGMQLDLSKKYFSFDTEDTNDLKSVIKLFENLRGKILWIGSAGLMDCLIRNKSKSLPSLALIGSISETAEDQLKEAEKFGYQMVKLPVYKIYKSGNYDSFVNKASMSLKAGKDTILYSDASYDRKDLKKTIQNFEKEGVDKKEREQIIQTVLAGICRRTILKQPISGVYITGGSTAKGFLEIVKANGAQTLGEIGWGIPLMRIEGGEFNNLIIATKAGAFGNQGVIPWVMSKIKTSKS